MQNDMKPDGRVVVILGMDRTGTSLCMNILNALGMRLSPGLMPGDRFNETGYFEDREIYQAHQQILDACDRSWETLEAIHPFPALWWQSPAMDPFRDALVDIVRRRRDAGPGIWGFKDPRTAALFPLWNDVFRICGVRPVFVLCVRHPAAVAHSIYARDLFSLLFSELLWFERTLDGCLAIRDASHCVIHYEEWFKDPLPQTRILCEIAGLAPAADSAAVQARVSATVDSTLRHQDGGAIMSTAARNLYAHLAQSAIIPDPAVLSRFEFALEVAREYFSDVRHLIGKRHHEQWALVEDRNRWMDRGQAAEQALIELDARLRESEEDRARWMTGCSAAENDAQHEREQLLRVSSLLKERDREIAAIRASATWRWAQNALGSWPAQRLLGPFIRAVAGHRKE
jgi:hypothetical protein